MNKRQLNKILVRTVALFLSFLTLFFCVPGTAYAATVESVEDELSCETGLCYTYDGQGRLTGAFPARYNASSTGYSAEDGRESVSYGYSPEGYLAYIETESVQYSFSYDDYGASSSVNAGDETLATYEYNPENGKLVKVIYGNLAYERYEYNELEQLYRIYRYNKGVETLACEYVYTKDGKLYSVDDKVSGKVTVYEYDRAGRFVGLHEYGVDDYYVDFITEVKYDAESRVSSEKICIAYNLGGAAQKRELNTAYEYDGQGRLTEYGSGGAYTYYGYDSIDRLNEITVAAGGFNSNIQYLYSDGSATRIERYISTVESTTTQYDISYDDKGYICELTKNQGETVQYYYDALGQLVRENNEYSGRTYIYEYDDAGNILVKKTYSVVYGNTNLGTLIETKVYGYANSDWGDMLTSYDGVDFTYDRAGNPTRYYNGQSYTFSWDGRRLESAVKGNLSFTFTYNDEGIRTSKTVNGVEHNYLIYGSQMLGELWEDKIIIYIYDGSGTPIGFSYTSANDSYWQNFWFEKNIFGDIVAVYNNVGTKIVSYNYDAWGNILSETYNSAASSSDRAIAGYNLFRYRGYIYDADLGLYYLQSRYYDSKIGRFINADTTDILGVSPGALTDNNLFAYCDNNPVMRTDESGEIWHIFAGAIVGGFIGGAAKVISNFIHREDPFKDVGKSIMSGAIDGAISSTGLGLAGQIIAKSVVAMAENVNEQISENGGFKNFDVGEMLVDGISGAIFGAIDGPGKGSKHLTKMGLNSIKRTVNDLRYNGFKSAAKEGRKALKYSLKCGGKFYRKIKSEFFENLKTSALRTTIMDFLIRGV